MGEKLEIIEPKIEKEVAGDQVKQGDIIYSLEQTSSRSKTNIIREKRA